ncbi:hypothetical protein PCYB_053680 [Plasmodium cynomolgi strain B]|uniref:Asparagine-rich protein n=1 Tax=Plasmodium cynomolgi (strain B) TaxID=1120755 RepID=K6UTC7_PLACD|nr:hypothetical protein PCYB_053680 [Plasmodium cynomolgi strain B]GAB65350.1 hypothetical protein PCYB_053680 [Plasmodium cynomolgi strain B]
MHIIRVTSLVVLLVCCYTNGKSIFRKRKIIYGSSHLLNAPDDEATKLPSLNNLKTKESHSSNDDGDEYVKGSYYVEKGGKNNVRDVKNGSFILLSEKVKDIPPEEEDEEAHGDDNADHVNNNVDSHNNIDHENSSEDSSESEHSDHEEEHDDDDMHHNHMYANGASTALPPPPPPVMHHPPPPPMTPSGIVGHVVSNVFTAGLKLFGVP